MLYGAIGRCTLDVGRITCIYFHCCCIVPITIIIAVLMENRAEGKERALIGGTVQELHLLNSRLLICTLQNMNSMLPFIHLYLKVSCTMAMEFSSVL